MRRSHRILSVIAALWWIAIVYGAFRALNASDDVFYPAIMGVPGYGTVGGLLGIRRPTSAFGWLLLATLSVPLLASTVGIPVELQNGILVAGLALVFVLFPTGRPPSRVWFVPMALVVVSWLSLGHLGYLSFANGFDLDVGVVVGTLSLLVCAAAPIVRSRRAEGLVRAQIQWLGAACGATVVGLVLMAGGLATGVEPLMELGGLIASLVVGFGIPIAILMAILRHGLYDIGRIVTRTVAYGIVVAVLTIGYIGAVIGIGAIAGIWISSDRLGVPVPIISTALVSLAFQPARTRALRTANRWVYGRRRTPYEALAGITGMSLDEVLAQIPRLATEATAARRAVVWLSSGEELTPAAAYPDDELPDPISFDGADVPVDLDGGHALPLRHQEMLLGAISVYTATDEALAREDLRLLGDLAAHAAVSIHGALYSFPLPTGTVTFLMTDIEGSTRLWEDDADAMGRAIRQHDALVRRVVTDGGGLLIKWRGEGDSTFSVFTDGVAAVRTAAALQRAISGEVWPTPRPIVVRAALHTGEAELRERDYFGRTVNRCARLRGLAVGGQTLMTAATREMTRDGMPEPLTVRDLGEQTLRDVAEPEHVYELIAPDAVPAPDGSEPSTVQMPHMGSSSV